MTKRLDSRLKVVAQTLGMKRSPVFAVAWFMRGQMGLEEIAIELECSAATLKPVFDAVKRAMEEEAGTRQKAKERNAPKKGKPHPLPADWQPSADDVAYANSKGFDESQIREIAHSFRVYWIERKIERAVWSMTWQTWIQRQAGREAERRQSAAPAATGVISADRWQRAIDEWKETGMWPAALGPQPFAAGCRAPREMIPQRA